MSVSPFSAVIQRLSSRADRPEVQMAIGMLADSLWRSLSLGHIVYLCEDSSLAMLCLESTLVSQEPASLFVYDVLSEGYHFYFSRYYMAELFLARAVHQRLRYHPYRSLEALPVLSSSLSEEQARAVYAALLYPFIVITGGPGTGKTTVIASIIAVLVQVDPQINIVLLAPTGKAVARLEEVVGAHFPVMTIHSFLSSQEAAYWDDQHIIVDVLIIDEMSMLDTMLAATLCRALSPHTRLVLVGDPHQLYAVEAGSLLSEHGYWGEIPYDHREVLMRLSTPMMHLQTCYRFGHQQDLMALVQAVHHNAEHFFMKLSTDSPSITWYDRSYSEVDVDLLMAGYTAFFESLLQKEWAVSSQLFAQYRILTAYRSGIQGIAAINTAICRAIRSRLGIADSYYEGLPIMVTKNDPWLSLYNGNIGFLYREQEAWHVWFSSQQQCLLSQISSFEIAYAMTVHKSQGSEFDHVSIVLPEERHDLLSQQWLYTALTRAKNKVTLWATGPVLRHILETKEKRFSGISRKIYALSDPSIS